MDLSLALAIHFLKSTEMPRAELDMASSSGPQSATISLNGWVANAAINVSLGVVAVLVGVGLLELLVRTFDPQLLYRYPQGMFVNDAAIDYRLAPGFDGRMETPEYSTWIHIDQAGLRDSREVGPKAAGERRVLILGDSFVMGHGVEEKETFVRLVEDGLNARAGRPAFRLLNSGVPGYSTREELAYLRTRGLPLEPDAIVLAFFIGNDIVDNADHNRHYRVIDGYLTGGGPAPGILPVSVRSFLSRNSDLYHLLWPIQRRLRGLPIPTTADALIACGFEADASSWATTDSLLGQLAETARVHGLPLLIVVIPDLVQLEPDLWVQASQEREGLDPSRPDHKVMSIAAAHGLPALDLYQVLRTATERDRLYFPIDHHFTRAGNRIAADAIMPFIWEYLSKLL